VGVFHHKLQLSSATSVVRLLTRDLAPRRRRNLQYRC